MMMNTELKSQINKELNSLYPLLKRFREDLHQHPELSWQEYRTTKKIEEFLKKNGLTNFKKPIDTGGYIDFVYKSKFPFILLRADIDALPIQDKKKKPYASKNKGVCHSCGHDMHTTIILGLAILIQKARLEFPFNLRFVFQPAEETIPNGATPMIKAGVLKKVKYAFGLHMEPRLDVKTVSLTAGWINMQSVRLNIIISGKSGHSAYPSKCNDPIWIASRIIQDSYQIIYREIDILKSPTILSFTEIQAGEGYNIIPARLSMSGTFRTADMEAKKLFFNKFSVLTKSIEGETGAKIDVECIEGAPPVLNNPELTQKLQENTKKFDKTTKIVTELRSPGGDDFGLYSQKIPSVLFRFGTAKNGVAPRLHTDTFDVPPEVIKTSILFLMNQLLFLEV